MLAWRSDSYLDWLAGDEPAIRGPGSPRTSLGISPIRASDDHFGEILSASAMMPGALASARYPSHESGA